MTNEEIEKRIENLEKWAATTFDSFRRFNSNQVAQSEFLDNTTKRGGSADNIIKDIVDLEPHTEPQFTFTDDEKVILRNLSKRYKWIARDEGNDLYVYSNKPHKAQSAWVDGIECNNLSVFNSIFQSIKWQDNEPCEFKNFL